MFNLTPGDFLRNDQKFFEREVKKVKKLSFQEGDRIDHILHDIGTVIMWDGSTMVKVKFDSGKIEWVYTGYCTKLES